MPCGAVIITVQRLRFFGCLSATMSRSFEPRKNPEEEGEVWFDGDKGRPTVWRTFDDSLEEWERKKAKQNRPLEAEEMNGDSEMREKEDNLELVDMGPDRMDVESDKSGERSISAATGADHRERDKPKKKKSTGVIERLHRDVKANLRKEDIPTRESLAQMKTYAGMSLDDWLHLRKKIYLRKGTVAEMMEWKAIYNKASRFYILSTLEG